jgi:hypothetical protein
MNWASVALVGAGEFPHNKHPEAIERGCGIGSAKLGELKWRWAVVYLNSRVSPFLADCPMLGACPIWGGGGLGMLGKSGVWGFWALVIYGALRLGSTLTKPFMEISIFLPGTSP